ncbi:lamin tail domain-containing protein [Streptomyces olivochromogenes]|nr:lamin tail domain-containing protein [Streptomyces olivochromogenes]
MPGRRGSACPRCGAARRGPCRAVNLDRWTLSDEDGHTFTFHHFRLNGRSTVRVHTGVGRDSRTDVYRDRRNYVWNNDDETVTLRDERGRFVDDESWGHHRWQLRLSNALGELVISGPDTASEGRGVVWISGSSRGCSRPRGPSSAYRESIRWSTGTRR